MNHSLLRTVIGFPTWALIFGVAACAGQKPAAETAANDGSLPPNSADIHQQEMKEAEEVAEERREEAAGEAIENVNNASVIENHPESLTTDEVDTDPND